MSAELAPLLYRELIQIAEHASWDARKQAPALGVLMERLFLEATKREQLAFSSLFARISYVGHIHQFPQESLQIIHHFRRRYARIRDGSNAAGRDVRLGVQALAETVHILYQTAIPDAVGRLFPPPGEWRFDAPENWTHKEAARVVAVAQLPEENALLAVDEERPAQTVKVLYGLADRNENFSPTIRLIQQIFGFPLTMNLLDIALDDQGAYRPRVFILEPDYLLDVTAIAESFKEHGAEPLYYLVKKFLPYEVTPPILLGNVANFFLDRLLNEPAAPFDQLLRETFGLFPLAYAPMSDKEVLEVRQKAQKHYLNLQFMARSGLAKQGIEPGLSVLEPTFYSERYGLQGRLDLLHRHEDKAAIVELKSGRPFRPNSYGIQRSHFTQTLLYDLLVRSVFGAATDPVKYILYSGADLNPLRFAPTVAPEQWEALQVRNQLVAIERLLTTIPPGAETNPLLSRLTAKSGSGKGFLQRDFAQFEQVYARLHPWEKKYFNSFTGFIAREAMLAKIGTPDSDNINGNAALWRSSFEEKQHNFSILSHLTILENQADQEDPWIRFQKTEQTNPLANFRVGDIAVLYPSQKEGDTVLQHQVIKCTITALEPDTVTVQLRYRQFNLYPFQTGTSWNLEPDMLETGFVSMYRSLFEWAAAPEAVRRRVVNPTPSPSPFNPTPSPSPFNPTPSPSPGGEGNTSEGSLPHLTTPLPNLQTTPLPSRGGAGGGVNQAGDDIIPDADNDTTAENVGKASVYLTDGAIYPVLKAYSREMRKTPTQAEQSLWQLLRGNKLGGFKFRRQHPIGPYIADFVNLDHRLVIELDGPIHDERCDYDNFRTAYLNQLNFTVVRYKNEDVIENPQDVLNDILEKIKQLQSLPRTNLQTTPLPSRGGAGGGVNQAGGGVIQAGAGATLTPEQHHILQKIIHSPHFFLLWGPPGTGKTSVMLHAYAEWVLRDTDDNLLLLAYTNRAVDEICDTLDRIGGTIRDQYLRIGSRFSTADRFREQLLQQRIAGVTNRAELRTILEKRRIFVGTVASFAQNDTLMRLKKFHRLVIDEASQLLEPQLIGLLTRFEHAVLIGDHRQLPAVTTQGPEWTLVKDPELNDMGLTNLSDSYFERLYRRFVQEGRQDAYGQLSHQGRMHRDIMAFPNQHFYNGMLKVLPDPHAAGQEAPLQYQVPEPCTDWERHLTRQRVVFFPTPPEDALPGQKTSRAEADWAVRIFQFFRRLYLENGLDWDPSKEVGIITPWRAQIAQIRESLSTAGENPDAFTIDTVERYQGGARNLIIISCCVHSEYQLNSLVNISGEGVDRKFNVALTRARQHVIVLGNRAILEKDERYRAFIQTYCFNP